MSTVLLMLMENDILIRIYNWLQTFSHWMERNRQGLFIDHNIYFVVGLPNTTVLQLSVQNPNFWVKMQRSNKTPIVSLTIINDQFFIILAKQ